MHLTLSFSFTNIAMGSTISKLVIMVNIEGFLSAIMSMNAPWKSYNHFLMNGKLMMSVLHVVSHITIRLRCYKLYSYSSL